MSSSFDDIIKDPNWPFINQQNNPICGIPDEATIIRQYCWKIVLGLLPQKKDQWQIAIQNNQKTYQQMVKMFLSQQVYQDYPIIMNKQHQRWQQLQQSFCLWQQIQKDTSRTHAQLSFFTVPAPNIMLPFFTHPRKQKYKIIYGQDQKSYKQFLKDKQQQRKTYRYDYMSRILYIYAKLNPHIQYVQGMNQILAPIFYIVNLTKGPGSLVQQASCFLMFNNAITDIIQLHMKDLDKTQNGIYGKMQDIKDMLMVLDIQLWHRLQLLKIGPFYYCFRWMTLLFAQDFPLFDTLRIWQSIFSNQDRMLYMCLFSISLLKQGKQYILQHDFVQVMTYLQNPGQNINPLNAINTANKLYQQNINKDFKNQAIQLTNQLKRKQQRDKMIDKNIKKITGMFKGFWK